MKLAHLNWRQAERVLADHSTTVVIPIGSTEQHGPVGPLGTDWMIPEWIAGEMEKRTNILVAPVIPFGVATHHTSFPGTIDMGLETLVAVMRGVFGSLAKHGARRFIVVNGHGGNDPAIEKAGLEISRSTGALVALLNWWSIAPQLNPAWTTGHGDDLDSVGILNMLSTMEITGKDCGGNDLAGGAPKFYKGAAVKLVRDLKLGLPQGGFGGIPSEKASAEWGRDMMEAVVEYFTAFAEDFGKLPLDRPSA